MQPLKRKIWSDWTPSTTLLGFPSIRFTRYDTDETDRRFTYRIARNARNAQRRTYAEHMDHNVRKTCNKCVRVQIELVTRGGVRGPAEAVLPRRQVIVHSLNAHSEPRKGTFQFPPGRLPNLFYETLILRTYTKRPRRSARPNTYDSRNVPRAPVAVFPARCSGRRRLYFSRGFNYVGGTQFWI